MKTIVSQEHQSGENIKPEKPGNSGLEGCLL